MILMTKKGVERELNEAILESEGKDFGWVDKEVVVGALKHKLAQTVILNKKQEDSTFITSVIFSGKIMICVTEEEILFS